MIEEPDLAAQPQTPLPLWIFQALGIRYTLLLPLLGILAVVLAVIALWKFKSPVLVPILIVVVPLPMYYGAIGIIDGLVASWQVIEASGMTPKPSDFAYGTAMSLVSLQVGLILSLPAYAIATLGLVYRALRPTEVLNSVP